MKLQEVEITDFRGIEYLKLPFLDELGRTRQVMPIVGPNTSGKTTILDAISLCLMPPTDLVQFREGLALTPPSIVRRGAVQARVTCTVWFSDDEIKAAKELIDKVGNPYTATIPNANEVKVHWEFPDRQGKHRSGYYHCEPKSAWTLFKGRITTVRSLHVPDVSPRDLERHGGVFMFDQQRTGLAKKIPESEQELLSHGSDPVSIQGQSTNDRDGHRTKYTKDPRLILLNLAVRAKAEQDPEATERADFERLKELYALVCHPHKIRGLYNTEYGLDMEFEGPHGVVYQFDGLSSGQEMVLLLLLQFATKRIHRSLVLIDELELHLHPLWQDRLYQSLTGLGIENQFLFTTHSTHLRDSIRGDFFHCTGELGDKAVLKERV